MSTKTFLIQGEGLGRGEEQLGKMLMANFLRLMGESPEKPKALIFWNAGVRLLAGDSPVLSYIQRLEGQGVEVLACTTCLQYLDLVEQIKAGKATTMVKSIEALMKTEVACL